MLFIDHLVKSSWVRLIQSHLDDNWVIIDAYKRSRNSHFSSYVQSKAILTLLWIRSTAEEDCGPKRVSVPVLII